MGSSKGKTQGKLVLTYVDICFLFVISRSTKNVLTDNSIEVYASGDEYLGIFIGIENTRRMQEMLFELNFSLFYFLFSMTRRFDDAMRIYSNSQYGHGRRPCCFSSRHAREASSSTVADTFQCNGSRFRPVKKTSYTN